MGFVAGSVFGSPARSPSAFLVRVASFLVIRSASGFLVRPECVSFPVVSVGFLNGSVGWLVGSQWLVGSLGFGLMWVHSWFVTPIFGNCFALSIILESNQSQQLFSAERNYLSGPVGIMKLQTCQPHFVGANHYTWCCVLNHEHFIAPLICNRIRVMPITFVLCNIIALWLPRAARCR